MENELNRLMNKEPTSIYEDVDFQNWLACLKARTVIQTPISFLLPIVFKGEQSKVQQDAL